MGWFGGRKSEWQEPGTVLEVVNQSFDWYRKHAKRASRFYFAAEVAVLVVGAAIHTPVVFTNGVRFLALSGAVVVIITGLRTVFRWRDDWLRYTDACLRLKPPSDSTV